MSWSTWSGSTSRWRSISWRLLMNMVAWAKITETRCSIQFSPVRASVPSDFPGHGSNSIAAHCSSVAGSPMRASASTSLRPLFSTLAIADGRSAGSGRLDFGNETIAEDWSARGGNIGLSIVMVVAHCFGFLGPAPRSSRGSRGLRTCQ